MDRNQYRNIAGFCLTVLLSIGLFAFDSDAQTTRRKPKPTPTSTPVRTTEPAVISRADDYPTVVIEPVPTPTDQGVPATSDVTIEELSEQTTALPLPTTDRRIGPAGADEAIGFSPNLSFDEAFADALAALPKLDGNTADQLENIAVLETVARIGGIVGFQHLFVRISRRVS
jgi:hypothetical protein